ncbi:MAG: sensor domain-containing diguanylate cyclase, partial [Nitrospinae bacterium]|nr:sensor domain-containing diguanylate cyclase [Nitrospinota bacterium]
MNNTQSFGLDDDLFISAQKESESLKERFFELYLLYTLSKNLNLSLQLNSLFDKTINLLKDSLKIDEFCFMLIDEECNELKIWKANDVTYEAAKDVTFKIGEGVSGIVAQTGESILIQDVSKDERFLYYKGKLPDIGSFMSIPLRLSDGRIIGVLNIHKREVNAFHENDKILFNAIANNVANAIERAKIHEKVQKESMFDYLTRLHTRKYFIESSHREHSKAERYGGVFSIIMIDIDHFKYFNDTYGHLLGDEALKKVASLLKSNVRQGDVVSRYGGEEFAMLLPGTDKDGATLNAEKLKTRVEKELVLEIGNSLEKITITAGVASYPEDGKTVEEIIAMADKFLYIGKEIGRNRVVNRVLDNLSVIDEKRVSNRYRIALKIARGANQIQSVEIKMDDKIWKICAVKDIPHSTLKCNKRRSHFKWCFKAQTLSGTVINKRFDMSNLMFSDFTK